MISSGISPSTAFFSRYFGRRCLIFQRSGMSMVNSTSSWSRNGTRASIDRRHADLVDAHQQQLRQPQPELVVDHARQHVLPGMIAIERLEERAETLKLSGARYVGSSTPAAIAAARLWLPAACRLVDQCSFIVSQNTMRAGPEMLAIARRAVDDVGVDRRARVAARQRRARAARRPRCSGFGS